ncbi:hypothetical protein EDB84DRAFT_347147 [Lactarius hengduanensis]|nr:hypothetical protein EDB84DRAFT_347147 [Lactarius hengduanensis]
MGPISSAATAVAAHWQAHSLRRLNLLTPLCVKPPAHGRNWRISRTAFPYYPSSASILRRLQLGFFTIFAADWQFPSTLPIVRDLIQVAASLPVAVRSHIPQRSPRARLTYGFVALEYCRRDLGTDDDATVAGYSQGAACHFTYVVRNCGSCKSD